MRIFEVLALQGLLFLILSIILSVVGVGHTRVSEARPWYIGAEVSLAVAVVSFLAALWIAGRSKDRPEDARFSKAERKAHKKLYKYGARGFWIWRSAETGFRRYSRDHNAE